MKLLKITEVAKMLNVSTRTLKRWHNKGILIAIITPTQRWFYKEEDIINFINNSKINNS